jgi:hypothetical protein
MPAENLVEYQDEGLSKFLLTEYDNIAAAHFKTLEMISEFIKHYLTIVAVPFTIIVLIFNIDYVKNAILQNLPVTIVMPIISILFIVFGAIGLLILLHIQNLRWDSLLYARTVNGIRKYFYDHDHELSLSEKSRIRVLPQSPYFPQYREFSFFGPIVLAFAMFNTLYVYSGVLSWEYAKGNPNPFESWIAIIVSALFFSLHIFLYLFLAQRRELSYLRSNTIGVDIDGVLNLHRDQFCKILQQNTGKVIHPDQITAIPVRDCVGLGVTQADEFSVFNDPQYWIDMPADPGAIDVLRRLKNSMKMKIHIFTSRPD